MVASQPFAVFLLDEDGIAWEAVQPQKSHVEYIYIYVYISYVYGMPS